MIRDKLVRLNDEFYDYLDHIAKDWEWQAKLRTPELFICDKHNVGVERSDLSYICPECFKDGVGFSCS